MRPPRGAPENGVKLLTPWLRLLPPPFHSWLLCDMAFYAGQAQRHEEAVYLLHRAQQEVLCHGGETPGEYGHFQLTHARVLLSGGKPVEALERLPPPTDGDGRIHGLLVW